MRRPPPLQGELPLVWGCPSALPLFPLLRSFVHTPPLRATERNGDWFCLLRVRRSDGRGSVRRDPWLRSDYTTLRSRIYKKGGVNLQFGGYPQPDQSKTMAVGLALSGEANLRLLTNSF